MKGTLVNLCWTQGLFARITIRYSGLTINATNANAPVESPFLIVEPEGQKSLSGINALLRIYHSVL